MAALDFPNSPIVGQVYTANGKSWTWDGTVWLASSTAVQTFVNPLLVMGA